MKTKGRIESAEVFGKIIKDCRKRQKITQSQLAAVSATGVRFISDLENGKPSIQLDKALKAASMLGLSLVVAEPEPIYTTGEDDG